VDSATAKVDQEQNQNDYCRDRCSDASLRAEGAAGDKNRTGGGERHSRNIDALEGQSGATEGLAGVPGEVETPGSRDTPGVERGVPVRVGRAATADPSIPTRAATKRRNVASLFFELLLTEFEQQAARGGSRFSETWRVMGCMTLNSGRQSPAERRFGERSLVRAGR
jgi:hypothetical protein